MPDRIERLEARCLFSASLETYAFNDLPAAGTTPAGQKVALGGFSSLV